MIWILTFTFFFFSCGNQNISGGTGTETTNSIRVINADGTPIKDTEVDVFYDQDWYAKVSLGRSAIKQKLKTNSVGILEIPDSLLTNLALISILINDQKMNTLFHLNNDTLTLSNYNTLSGSVLGYDSVYVAGTNLVTKIDSLGNFAFENLASQGFQLLFKKENIFSPGPFVKLESDSSISIDTLKSDILINDFIGSENTSPSTLKWMGGSLSNWYLFTSGQSEMNNVFISKNSNFLRKEIFFDSQKPKDFIRWGLSFFGPQWKYGINLIGFEFLELKMRGNMGFKISLETQMTENLNDSLGKDQGHFEAYIKLNENWENHKIPYENFALPIYQKDYVETHPLDEAIKKAIRLEFIFSKDSTMTKENYWFEIDKITFKGVKEKLW